MYSIRDGRITMMKRYSYPFCAILGQEKMKQALLLNVINPKIGGVLLCGEKGCAKSTVVRALAQLLEDRKMVELPLNITEDCLVGSICLESAFREGKRCFAPGLLQRADGNLLYIDEVNLLSDYIVNTLLEVASSGVNHIEREGISYTHPSRFVLIGSMNPEEGKMRSQFLDRFGLYVEVTSSKVSYERAEIIRRRLAYEQDAKAFADSWQDKQREVRKRIQDAIQFLPRVEVTENAMHLAAFYSAEAHCAGYRGELVLIETAKAIAAWDLRTVINTEDLEAAAEFVLPHRMREEESAHNPPLQEQDISPSSEQEQTQTEEQPKQPEEQAEEALEEPLEEEAVSADTCGEQQQSLSDSRGEDKEEIQEIGDIFPVRPWITDIAHLTIRQGNGRRSLVKTSTRQGRYVRAAFPKGDKSDIALDATLRAAAPYQREREKDGLAIMISPEDIRVKVRERRTGNTILFLVDASGSMGANKRMQAVKGAIFSLLQDAYQKRDRVGMVAFRKNTAELILGITRSVELAQKKLQMLPTGGKTPLSAGLKLSRELLRTEKMKDKDSLPVLVILSDGRANVSQSGQKPLEEVLEEGKKFARDGIRCIVVDTEKDFIRLELAVKLAKAMQADYFRIEDLTADSLKDIVTITIDG